MQKILHADNLWRSSSREKYSACKANKTEYVTYDNLRGVVHILEATQSVLSLVWVNIALSINFDTKNKILYPCTLIFTLLSKVKFNLQRYYSL